MAELQALGERVKSSPAVKESKIHAQLVDFAAENAAAIESLSQRPVLPPEQRTRLNDALAGSLGLDGSKLRVNVVWTNTNGTVMLRVSDPDLGEIAKIEVGAKDGKFNGHLEAALSPDMMLRNGIGIERRDVEQVIFPSHVRREKVGVIDPQLEHIAPVYQRLFERMHTDGRMNSLERGETAAFVARDLDALKLEPTRENVRRSLERVDAARTRFNDVPLFEGRAILLGAHSETVLARSENRLSPDGAAGAQENAERGRDDHRFGREFLQQSLKLLAGDQGSVELVRPEPLGTLKADRLRHFVHINRELFENLNRDADLFKNNPEAEKSVREILADVLDLEDSSKLKWTFTPQKPDDAMGQATFDISYDGKRSAVSGMRFNANGRMTLGDARSFAHTPEEDRTEITRARDEFLQKIREMPPGPNGFTGFFDGHGASTLVAMNEGVPVHGENGVQISTTNPLRAEDFAAAIVERYKTFPADPAKPDIYIFASCVSGSFINEVASRVRDAGVPVPLMISQTEFNMLGSSNSILPVGSRFIEDLLMPYTPDKLATGLEDAVAVDGFAVVGAQKHPWNPEQVKRSPTVGDIVRYYTENPLGPESNPRIIAPQPAEDGGWIQIR